MPSVPIDVLCEVAGADDDAKFDAVRDAAAAELAVIATDLQLDAEFRLDVRSPAVKAGAAAPAGLVFYVDGMALPPWPDWDTAAAIRAQWVDLITPRLIDHWWEAWGGRSVAPADFVDVVRDLVRHRVRPNRASAAVSAWGAPESQPFDDALNQADRRIRVHVHPERVAELQATFEPEAGSHATLMIDGLFYELGVVLGRCELVPDQAQPQDRARVCINDLRSGPLLLLKSDESIVNDTPDRLALLGIEGRIALNPSNGAECAVISRARAAEAEQAGLTTWDAGAWLIVGVSAEVRKSAAAVLNGDAVGSLLDRLGTAFPYLSSYVRQRIGVQRFGRVLRRLLEEDVSIRNLRQVINAVALMSPAVARADAAQFIVFSSTYSAVSTGLVTAESTQDALAAEMTEAVRAHMKRYLSHKYTRGGSTLIVYLLAPEMEQRLRDRRSFSAAERRQLHDAVRSETGSLPPTANVSCLLTTAEIRRRLRSEIATHFPRVPVLSYQELSPDLNIQPIARITLDPKQQPAPLESIDAEIDALQFENAEAATRRAMGVVPKEILASRAVELCYVWNEAGRADRLAAALRLLLETETDPPAQATLLSLVDRPEQEAVRTWLLGRYPALTRRLRVRYRLAPDDLVVATGRPFQMGDPDATAGDGPVHPVDLDDFSIAPYPVTGAQFALYLAAQGEPVPVSWARSDEAVRGISWIEAIAYCNWLSRRSGLEPVYAFADNAVSTTAVKADHSRSGFRLPTEAEWEYAARGGPLSRGFRYAGSNRLEDVSTAGTRAVGSRPGNELRLYDMSCGPEWCWDWYAPAYYATSPPRNPTGPLEGTAKVCRGGDTRDAGDHAACTVFHRVHAPPEGQVARQANVALRVVRTGAATR